MTTEISAHEKMLPNERCIIQTSDPSAPEGTFLKILPTDNFAIIGLFSGSPEEATPVGFVEVTRTGLAAYRGFENPKLITVADHYAEALAALVA